MNLNLEAVPSTKSTASTELLLLNLLTDSTDVQEAFHDVEQGFTTLAHLSAIQNTVKQHGCTESLVSLYGDNNLTLSTEGISETLKKAWDWIVEKLKWLWEKITSFVKNLFGFNKQADALVEEAKKEADKAKRGSKASHEAVETRLLGLPHGLVRSIIVGVGRFVQIIDVMKKTFREIGAKKYLPAHEEILTTVADALRAINEACNDAREHLPGSANDYKELVPVSPTTAVENVVKLRRLLHSINNSKAKDLPAMIGILKKDAEGARNETIRGAGAENAPKEAQAELFKLVVILTRNTYSIVQVYNAMIYRAMHVQVICLKRFNASLLG